MISTVPRAHALGFMLAPALPVWRMDCVVARRVYSRLKLSNSEMLRMRNKSFKKIIFFSMCILLFCSCAGSNREIRDQKTTLPFPPMEDIRNELKDIKVASIYRQGTDTLTIDFNLSRFISTSAKDEVLQILRVIKEMNLGYEAYKIRGISPVADEYGNKEEKLVIYLIYKRESIQKINLEGMRVENVFRIADFKEIHPQIEQ